MPMKTTSLMESAGVVRDVPPQVLREDMFTDIKNFRFSEKGAAPIEGDQSVLSEASITPLWLWPFPPITDPKWVYADATAVWAIDGSTHTDITRLSGAYNAVAAERWQATTLAGFGVLNNTIDIPQSWQGFDPVNELEDLANWPATRRCKSLRSFKNFLVALYMIDSGVERPYRILWSNPAAPGALPTSWDSANPATEANEIDLAETPDYLVDSLLLGDVNIIYKENTTWGMSYIGPPFHFRFFKILSHRGLLNRDCVVNFTGGHCVATQDDIIIHSGQIESAESIVNRRLRRSLFSSIDPTNFRNCFMFADNYLNEVWFCYPEVGETYATKAVVWNWRSNSIGERDLTPTPFVVVGPIGDSLIQDRIWG